MATLEEETPTDLVVWEGGEENEDYDPEAPYGRNKDGTPSKKRGRKAGSSGGSISLTGKSKGALEREIYEAIGGDIAATVGTVAPLVAYVLEERAERTARALASIANRSPNFKKGLEKTLVYRDVLTLVSLAPAIAVAVAIEMGIVKPDSNMSSRFNLYKPWLEMYGDGGSETMPDYHTPEPIGLLAQ